jgi:hypothetical protein
VISFSEAVMAANPAPRRKADFLATTQDHRRNAVSLS